MADVEKGLNPAEFSVRAPTQNVDGTPVDGELSYNLYRLVDEQDPTSGQLYLSLPAQLTDENGEFVVQLPQFIAGRHVIVLTAVDIDGDESAPSNTLGFTRTAVGVAPSAPSIA